MGWVLLGITWLVAAAMAAVLIGRGIRLADRRAALLVGDGMWFLPPAVPSPSGASVVTPAHSSSVAVTSPEACSSWAAS
jgi:hypothetical protein